MYYSIRLLLLLLRIWLSSDHCFLQIICVPRSLPIFLYYVLSLQGNQGWGLPSCSWVKGPSSPPRRMGPPTWGLVFQADHHGHWWKAPGAQAASLGEGIACRALAVTRHVVLYHRDSSMGPYHFTTQLFLSMRDLVKFHLMVFPNMLLSLG